MGVISQESVGELSHCIATKHHGTDQSNFFWSKNTGIHERLFHHIQGETTNIPQPVTQGDHNDYVAAITTEQLISGDRIIAVGQVRSSSKQTKYHPACAPIGATLQRCISCA